MKGLKIRKYVAEHEEMLAKPGVHLVLGHCDGHVYLDLSILTQSIDEAAELGREHDQIGLFHLSNSLDWHRVDLDGVMRYIPVTSDDSDIDYLADLSPAMFTMLDSIAKRRGDQPVIFVAGSDIDEETIPKIHAEVCTCIVNKGHKKAPKGYHYMLMGR